MVFEATIKYILRPKVIDKIAEMVTEKFNAEISTPTALLSLEKELKEVNKSINGIMTAIENGIFTKTTKERLLNLEAEQSELENKIAVEQARQVKPLQPNEVKKFLTYFAYMKYEKGEEKNEFFNSFINRVILYDDKVIILYNSNDRETKRLSKKQLKDIENAKTLEDIKENSLEPKNFKRVALGAPKKNFRFFTESSFFILFLLDFFVKMMYTVYIIRYGYSPCTLGYGCRGLFLFIALFNRFY